MSKKEHEGKSLDEIAELLGLGRFHTHLFLCTGPDCCTPDEGQAAWDAVKRAVKQLNPDLRAAQLYRSKVGCLRVCKSGPTAVAYPQGKWFHSVTADNAADVVAYLQFGARGTHPLEFRQHPLAGEPSADVAPPAPPREDAAD